MARSDPGFDLKLTGTGPSSFACEDSSKTYKELRERGKMIGEFDTLIASNVK